MENKTQIKRRAVRDMTIAPVMFTEDCWANSMLSIEHDTTAQSTTADIGTLSLTSLAATCGNARQSLRRKEGRDKAIEPGEPADLIREDFKRVYRKYGRDRFIEALKNNPDVWTPKELEKKLKNDNR